MISENAVVNSRAIGKDVTVGDFAVIAEGARIGSGCVIHPHVVIGDGVELGENVEVFPGAVLGKEPKGAGATARTPEFEKRVQIGRGCSIGPNAVVYYDVSIGDCTLLGDGASIREKCTVGSNCIISRYVTINYNTRIGSRTKIMDLTHLTGNMVVEDEVFVSVLVSTTNDNTIGRDGYDESKIIGPHISRGAMIGAGASLLPGVKIGKNSIVGANAVVAKDVPDEVVVVGVPARVVRER